MAKAVEDWELSAFIDGDLPPRRMAEVEAAAAESPELRQRLSEMLADHRRLAALGNAELDRMGELPPHLAALAADLEAELELGAIRRERRSQRILAHVWRYAAVLVVGTTVGWTAASWATSRNDVLLDFVDEAAEVHRVVGLTQGFTREVSPATISSLGTLFAHKLLPPDLAEAGFTVMGVDVAATDSGPAAVFVYTDLEARRLSLVLSLDYPLIESLGQTSAAPRVTTHDGLSVSFGQENGVAYAVVGAFPQPRTRMIAEQVAEALSR